MKHKIPLSPVPANKTPTTPIRSARINTAQHNKKNSSFRSNCSVTMKHHKIKDSDITEREREKEKTTVANTNVNTHVK